MDIENKIITYSFKPRTGVYYNIISNIILINIAVIVFAFLNVKEELLVFLILLAVVILTTGVQAFLLLNFIPYSRKKVIFNLEDGCIKEKTSKCEMNYDMKDLQSISIHMPYIVGSYRGLFYDYWRYTFSNGKELILTSLNGSSFYVPYNIEPEINEVIFVRNIIRKGGLDVCNKKSDFDLDIHHLIYRSRDYSKSYLKHILERRSTGDFSEKEVIAAEYVMNEDKIQKTFCVAIVDGENY